MMQRQLFTFSDTGTQSDTGPHFFGEIKQYRWVHVSGDTGGSVEITLMPRTGDTGDGWVIANHGLLAPQQSKALRQPQHGSDGAADPSDTGAAFGVPIVAAGDRLRVTRIASAAGAIVGRLYVWVGE
jgi:hypothetical protein